MILIKYSTNKNFKLPEYSDVIDVADFNENFELIDTELKTLSDSQSELEASTLPKVSSTNNGQFLRVVNGVWTAVTVPSAEGASV